MIFPPIGIQNQLPFINTVQTIYYCIEILNTKVQKLIDNEILIFQLNQYRYCWHLPNKKHNALVYTTVLIIALKKYSVAKTILCRVFCRVLGYVVVAVLLGCLPPPKQLLFVKGGIFPPSLSQKATFFRGIFFHSLQLPCNRGCSYLLP